MFKAFHFQEFYNLKMFTLELNLAISVRELDKY
jgi:hypothetical protein